MTVDDSEMQKLWKLTNELTAQLVFNRNATLELKQQLAALQSTAAGRPPAMAVSGYGDHDHTDYKLRIANERLREENMQLQEQVREYERWMEFIMGKFRLQSFAMAQSRRESMQEAYRMTEQGEETAMRLREENTLLQARLSDLGAAARKAIHEEYYTTETVMESLETENRCLREMLGLAEGGNGAFTGRISLHMDEDDEEDRLRRHRNRVSFPSTSTASDSEILSPDPLPPQHPLPAPSSWQPNRQCRFILETSVPLSVQTGLRSPPSFPTSPRSLSPLSLSTSTPSTSWSPPASASSRTLSSPALYGSPDQFKSISPPLDAATEQVSAKQTGQRGKITINTEVGSSLP